ncbi:hypothetical protein RQP46_008688 [Phenoliferia psychrophenolica]
MDSFSPPRKRKRKMVVDKIDLANLFHGLQGRPAAPPAPEPDASQEEEQEERIPPAQPVPPSRAPSVPPRPRAPMKRTLERPSNAATDELTVTVDAFLSLHSSKRVRTTYKAKPKSQPSKRRKLRSGDAPASLPPSSDADSESGPSRKPRRRHAWQLPSSPSSDSESDSDSPDPHAPPPKARRLRSVTGRLLRPLPVAHYLGQEQDDPPVEKKKGKRIVAPYPHAKHRAPMLTLARASQLEDGEGAAADQEKKGREVRRRKKGAPGRKESFLGGVADTAFAKQGASARRDDDGAPPRGKRKKSASRRIFTSDDAFVKLVQQLPEQPVKSRRARGKGTTKPKFAPLELEPEDFEVAAPSRIPTPPVVKKPPRLRAPRRDSPSPVVAPKPAPNLDLEMTRLNRTFNRTLRVKPRRPLAHPDDSATSQDGDNEQPPPPNPLARLPTPRAPKFRFGPPAKAKWGKALEMVQEAEAGTRYDRRRSLDDDADDGALEMIPEDVWDREVAGPSFDSSAEFAKISSAQLEGLFGDAQDDGGRLSLPSPAPSSPPSHPLRRHVTFSSPPNGSDIQSPQIFQRIPSTPHHARLRRSKTEARPPPSSAKSRSSGPASSAPSLKPFRRLSLRPSFRLPPSPVLPEPFPLASDAKYPDEEEDSDAMHTSSHEFEPPTPLPSSPAQLSCPLPPAQVQRNPASVESEHGTSWEGLGIEAVQGEEDEMMRWDDESLASEQDEEEEGIGYERSWRGEASFMGKVIVEEDVEVAMEVESSLWEGRGMLRV